MVLVLQARTLKYLPKHENNRVLNSKMLQNFRAQLEESMQKFVSLFFSEAATKKVVSLVLLQMFG